MSSSKLTMAIISRLRNTSKEFVDFVLSLSRLQDKQGRCIGIHYKDICQEIGISAQTFYNHRDMGELLKVFRVNWSSLTTKDNDWNMTFEDNRFDFDKGSERLTRYLNTNWDFLYTEAFRDIKLNAKILALYILANKQISERKARKLKYTTLMEYAGISSLPLLMEYLESLQPFFNIKVLEDCAVIELQHKSDPETEATKIHARHFIKTYCRQHRIDYDQDNLQYMAVLFCKFAENFWNVVMNQMDIFCRRHGVLFSQAIEERIITKMQVLKGQAAQA